MRGQSHSGPHKGKQQRKTGMCGEKNYMGRPRFGPWMVTLGESYFEMKERRQRKKRKAMTSKGKQNKQTVFLYASVDKESKDSKSRKNCEPKPLGGCCGAFIQKAREVETV